MAGVGQRIGITGGPSAVVVTVLVAVAISTYPTRWLPGVLIAAGTALLVLLLGLMTISGFTLPVWLGRRVKIAWTARRTRRRAASSSPGRHSTTSITTEDIAAVEHDEHDVDDDEIDESRAAAPPEGVVVHRINGIPVGVLPCRSAGRELIAVLRVDGPALDVHTVSSRVVTHGSSVIPTEVLEAAIGGLDGGAPDTYDLAIPGRRIAATWYSAVYERLLPGPVAGERTAYVILRFVPENDPWYFGARPAPLEAVAANVIRISRALLNAGCANAPLDDHELAALRDESAVEGIERWNNLEPATVRGTYETTYSLDLHNISDKRLGELWGLAASAVTLTFHHNAQGWFGFVRIRTAAAQLAPPLSYLYPIPGQQCGAMHFGNLKAVPRFTFTREPLSSLSARILPTGADGQVFGTTVDGTSILLPLVPAPGWRIEARQSHLLNSQLVVRAAAAGAEVTVITNESRRWDHLADQRIHVSAGTPAEVTGRSLFVYDEGTPVPESSLASVVVLADGHRDRKEDGTLETPLEAKEFLIEEFPDERLLVMEKGPHRWVVGPSVDQAETPILQPLHQESPA